MKGKLFQFPIIKKPLNNFKEYLERFPRKKTIDKNLKFQFFIDGLEILLIYTQPFCRIENFIVYGKVS